MNILAKAKTVEVFVFGGEEYATLGEARAAALRDFWCRYGYREMGADGAAAVCAERVYELVAILTAPPEQPAKRGPRHATGGGS